MAADILVSAVFISKSFRFTQLWFNATLLNRFTDIIKIVMTRFIIMKYPIDKIIILRYNYYGDYNL